MRLMRLSNGKTNLEVGVERQRRRCRRDARVVFHGELDIGDRGNAIVVGELWARAVDVEAKSDASDAAKTRV